jgi:hypothetical protein
MAVGEILRAVPTNVQVRYRGVFVPPYYDFLKTDVGISLLGKFAEAYNLRSTAIAINQNAPSTQYLSFRHVLPGEPFRYLDVSLGIDQAEIVFFNPATVSELTNEIGKVWSVIFQHSGPTVMNHHFEATLHCDTEGLSTKDFLSKLVNVQSDEVMQKGFSLTARPSDADGMARIALEVSESVPDGLYVFFIFVGKGTVRNMNSLTNLLQSTLITYRGMQTWAKIELLEPE